MNHKPPSPHWDRILAQKGKSPLHVGESVDNFLRKYLEVKPGEDLETKIEEVKKELEEMEIPKKEYQRFPFQTIYDSLILTMKHDWEWDLSNPSFKTFLSFLAKYFSRDQRKSFLVRSKPGLGKSTIMGLMSNWMKDTENAFQILHVSKIISNWQELELPLTKKIYKDYQKGDERKNDICIDDLGRDAEEKLYEYGRNPINMLVEQRYVLWQRHGVRTHFLTNYRENDLIEFYGAANYDRIRGMTLGVEIEGESKR